MGISPYLANLLLQSRYVPASHAQPPSGDPGGYDMQAAQDRALSSVYDPTEALQRGGEARTSAVLKETQLKGKLREQEMAGTIARLMAMKHFSEDNAFPQQEEQPSQGAYPRFNAPAVPERGAAQVDPTSRFLAGIAAAFAPDQFKGDLLASPLHGALEHANQVYQDKLRSYQMHYQQAQQAHEDDIDARNEEAKRLAYNASVKYGNKLGSYKAGHEDMLQIGAPLASIEAQRRMNPEIAKAEEEAATAGATEQNIGEEIKAKQEQSKEKVGIAKQFASFTERLAAAQLAAFQRATTATDRNASNEKIAGAKITSTEKIAENKETGLLNRMRAHDSFTGTQKDLDRKSHEIIANIQHSAAGRPGGNKMPASILQRKEIALNEATKATKRVMIEYAAAITKAGGEAKLDASVKQIFAKNFKAFQALELGARQERDDAMLQYKQSIANRGNGGKNLPGLPGIGRHLIYDPLKGTMKPAPAR